MIIHRHRTSDSKTAIVKIMNWRDSEKGQSLR